MTKIRFDSFAQTEPARDMQSGDVCRSEGPNARPLMMRGQPLSEPPLEALCFPNVESLPSPIDRACAEDINARAIIVGRTDRVDL